MELGEFDMLPLCETLGKSMVSREDFLSFFWHVILPAWGGGGVNIYVYHWYGEGLSRRTYTSYRDGERLNYMCGGIQPYFHTKDDLFG